MLLSCGHEGTPNGCATGYATRNNGEHICYGCADAEQVTALLTSDTYGAYFKVPEHGVRGDKVWHTITGSTLTTWTGRLLARVTYFTRCRHNIGGHLYRFNATDVHGQQWFGTSPGPGMYARMRKCKTQQRQYRVYWGPTGETLGTLWAITPAKATRQALRGLAHRKYPGEVGVECLSKF